MSRIPDKLRQVDVRAAMDFQSREPQGVNHQPRRNVQHEAKEQEALWTWVRLQPWRDDFYHWPNERQSRAEALKLSRQGVRRGPVDNWLLVRSGGLVGAVSELKRVGATRSSLSAEQRAFLLAREAQGWAVGVHRGWLEAKEFFEDYVAGNWSTDGQEWWR